MITQARGSVCTTSHLCLSFLLDYCNLPLCWVFDDIVITQFDLLLAFQLHSPQDVRFFVQHHRGLEVVSFFSDK